MANVSWPLREFENGVLVRHTDRTIVVDDGVVNAEAMRDKTQQALTANATYLAIASPSAAQNTAQVKALTRQVNALIRLITDRLDSTAGT